MSESTTVEAISAWKEQGIALAGAHNAQQWEIADWIVAGTELHGIEEVATLWNLSKDNHQNPVP